MAQKDGNCSQQQGNGDSNGNGNCYNIYFNYNGSCDSNGNNNNGKKDDKPDLAKMLTILGATFDVLSDLAVLLALIVGKDND